MAAVIEIPFAHPARRPNPYHLKIGSAPRYKCPYGCNEAFDECWRLDLHIFEKHPERRREAHPDAL